MAFLQRKCCLLWGKGFEVIWKTANVRCQLHPITSVYFSTSSFDAVQIKHNLQQMWKRIKKNDPKMDSFLDGPNIQKRINDLARIMECSVEEATELVKRDSNLGILDINNLNKRINLLKSYEFSTQDIIGNPSVLHRTYDVLEHRLSTLKILQCPTNEVSLSILKKSNFDFNVYVRKCCEEDQFWSVFSTLQDCLVVLLECDVETAEKLINENNLLSVSAVLLKSKIDVLKYFDISNHLIQDNIRVLVNTSITVLENRLLLLRENNLLHNPYIKVGHMLGCSPEDFKRSFALLKDRVTALEGCRDKKEYLIFRLKCSEKVAESLLNRKPINCMSEVKLRKKLDFFLIEMKVSYDFVISNVHLLGFSMERLQRRWPMISSNYNDASYFPKLLSISDERFKKSASISGQV